MAVHDTGAFARAGEAGGELVGRNEHQRLVAVGRVVLGTGLAG
ncbi:hypothetical protein ACLQ18_25380 [Streptomyces sp. DT193]